MASVELAPFGAEPLGRASLVCLAWVRRPAAPDHARLPLLRPERIELDRLEAERNRMRRVAFECPGAGLGIEVGEQAGRGVLGARPERDPICHRGRPGQDVGDLFAVEQGQRIDKNEAAYPLTHQFGGPARHHAAIAGADQHDILQVLVEQQLRHLVGLRFGCDTRTHLALALAATVEARGVDLMPRGAQPVRYRLPDPAALIGAVHQYVCRHGQFPPVTSMVTPVTKSASLDARKQITLAWSTASATRRSGVRSISACWSSGLDWSQRGRMRSVKVRLGAIALMV